MFTLEAETQQIEPIERSLAMYDAPSPPEDDTRELGREAFFIILIVCWIGFICYAGVMGNLVTTALGLPNTYIIKILATAFLGALGTALLLFLMRRPRRRR
jgi:hypothetical protein